MIKWLYANIFDRINNSSQNYICLIHYILWQLVRIKFMLAPSTRDLGKNLLKDIMLMQ